MNMLLLTPFIYIHLQSFTLFYILWHFADSKTIKQGLSAMGICVSGLLSGFRAVGGETSCRDPPAAQRRDSFWCKQGSSLWWDVGRQMQTFWFFRGDRSGRSSDVSCPLILQWTLDNYGTILIHEFFWILLICFENFWDVLSFEMFWAYMNILLLTSFTFLYILLIIVNIFFIIYIANFNNILNYLTIFTFCDILHHFADSKTITQGLSAMGICVSCLLSGFRAVGGETSCRDPPASQRICWCKQGSSLWWDVGREMQTFWFFRGDRSGRSSDVSCPLILQWTLDNYGTILIHELVCYVLRIFELSWDVLSIYEHSTSYIINIHYHSFTLF